MSAPTPGSYRKVEVPATAVETRFACALCEFEATSEDEIQAHAKNPGLHPGGKPHLISGDAPPAPPASSAVDLIEPAVPARPARSAPSGSKISRRAD